MSASASTTNDDDSPSTLDERRRNHALNARAKLFALAEVSVAFALMHLAFRAFKRFTALGQLEYRHDVNLSPGATLILVAVGMILLRRKRLSDFGITFRSFDHGVSAGLLCFLIYALVGAFALPGGWRPDPT